MSAVIRWHVGDWDGPVTVARENPTFRTELEKSLAKLEYEAEELARLPQLEVTIWTHSRTTKLLRDGRPALQPLYGNPGVVIEFVTKRHGHQVYRCDRYTHYRANIHAIALTLEAFRAINRWGVAKGEQYAGFSTTAIAPTGAATPSAPKPITEAIREAAGLLATEAGRAVDLILADPTIREQAFRDAVRQADHTPAGEAWLRRIVSANNLLKEAGR